MRSASFIFANLNKNPHFRPQFILHSVIFMIYCTLGINYYGTHEKAEHIFKTYR